MESLLLAARTLLGSLIDVGVIKQALHGSGKTNKTNANRRGAALGCRLFVSDRMGNGSDSYLLIPI